MLKKGISLQVHYIPIYRHKIFKDKFKFNKKNFQNSEKFYEQAISLPLFFDLKTKQQLKVIKTIKNILNI